MNIQAKVKRIKRLGKYSLRETGEEIGCSGEYVRLILDGKRGSSPSLEIARKVDEALARLEAV